MGAVGDLRLVKDSVLYGLGMVFLRMSSVMADDLSQGNLSYIGSWFRVYPFYHRRCLFACFLVLYKDRLSRMEYGKLVVI